MRTFAFIILVAAGLVGATTAPAVLFDFDNAPLHTSLPLDLTIGGITAHLSATGQGFSIQRVDAMGFTPAGFSGYCVYPSSVYAADLLIGFSQPMTDFSILYSPQELGCDDSATMRVTAYLNGSPVGTNTTTAPLPGTWPTGTLTSISAQSFDSVVIHYDSRPPTCQDWGPIFMAENMTVTPAPTALVNPLIAGDELRAVISPNPFVREATIRFQLARTGPVTVSVHDAEGHRVRTLLTGVALPAGPGSISWDGRDDSAREVASGVYLVRVRTEREATTARVVLVRGR